MKTFSQSVLDALKSYVDTRYDGNISASSRALGIKNPSILTLWLSGKRSPTVNSVSPALDAMQARLVLPDEKLVSYDLIPKVAAKAGAGASLETSDEVEGLYAFRKDFMAVRHISATRSVLMEVIGDSMEPRFSAGDMILVDKSDTEILDGKIYVVTLGDELCVKHAHKSLSGLILRSENPRYPDIVVEGPDLETLVIHGRVRWYSTVFD